MSNHPSFEKMSKTNHGSLMLKQRRIQPVRLGGRFQYYLVVKFYNSLATVREMKYSSQQAHNRGEAFGKFGNIV